MPPGSSRLRVSKTKQTRSHVRSLALINSPARETMRTRRASFIPVTPRAVRTFNAHKYPFIRDVRHSSTARDPSARHCPRKLKGVPRGFRFGAANHSRHSPVCPQKTAGFLFLSNAEWCANTVTLLPFLFHPFRRPMFFISKLPICRTYSLPLDISRIYLCKRS